MWGSRGTLPGVVSLYSTAYLWKTESVVDEMYLCRFYAESPICEITYEGQYVSPIATYNGEWRGAHQIKRLSIWLISISWNIPCVMINHNLFE